jgi:hypothetical protein
MAQPGFEGMWSTTTTLNDDPGWYAEDYFCFFGCTKVEYEMLQALIDDPANDDTPLNALRGQAGARGTAEFVGLLTDRARREYESSTPEDQLNEICLRYGLFGMAISVMPLRITDAGDRLIFDYETHDTHRVVYMRDSAPSAPAQPSRLGYSVAHYDGNSLVIETSGIEGAPFFVSKAQGLRHSDQLRTTEIYMLNDNGRTLDMVFTVEDPEVLMAPWVWVKKWRLAPQLELRHHEYDCSFVPGQR